MASFDNNFNTSAASMTSNLLAAENEKCPNCGSYFFKEVSVLKKLSALLSPTGKDEIVPLPIWVCEKCGEPAPTLKKNANYNKIVPSKIEI
jgi:ribosomal protein S27AE